MFQQFQPELRGWRVQEVVFAHLQTRIRPPGCDSSQPPRVPGPAVFWSQHLLRALNASKSPVLYRLSNNVALNPYGVLCSGPLNVSAPEYENSGVSFILTRGKGLILYRFLGAA